MATEEDIEMAQYIMTILKAYPEVIMSWGVEPESVKTVTQGLQFHVNGFKIKGTVKITYMPGPDLFKVEIKPDDEKEPGIIFKDIYFDQLVSVIDEAVEMTEDYEKRVCQEYGIVEET